MWIDLPFRRLRDVLMSRWSGAAACRERNRLTGSAARRGSTEARRHPPACAAERHRGSTLASPRWRSAYVRDVASTFQLDLTDPMCGVRNSGVDERRTS
jgi:hypothetical protein